MIPKFLVGAVAVILGEDNKVLLFRHTYRDEYPWGLPGGWLKMQESAVDAVEREIFEESGYEIRALYPLVIGGDPGQRRLDLIFLCEFAGGTFRPSGEVAEARFFAPDSLPGQVEPFHVEVVRYAVAVHREDANRRSGAASIQERS
jgi:ADP-ribose pyrophosphatase YjhB (NUDIX family)